MAFAKVPTKNNTYLSDLNEILLGYILAGNKWFDPDAKKQHDMRQAQVTSEQYMDAMQKADAMVKEFLSWAKKNKYSGKVKKVWWTARPGSMSAAYGKPVDQKKNPTDILVQFTMGPDNGYLGLSAKATKGKSDIGFKNLGVGTLEKSLKIDLSSIVEDQTNKVIKTFKLPTSTSQRKAAIRSKKNVQKVTVDLGQKLLGSLRDATLKRLAKMTNKELFNHITTDWMDSTATLPKYIKVTGFGDYTAKVTDPTKNDKMDALIKGPIRVEKNGISSVLVKAGGKNIMKMRFKWESEPFASSMKLSGDPAT